MTTEKMMILDGDVMREYTEAEYAQNAKDIADALAAKVEEDAKDAILEANKAAILEKLGITPDEAKLLLS
jgi:hypothetical protein